MIKSPSTWFFIVFSLFFFLVYADTVEVVPGTYSAIVWDINEAFSLSPWSAVYSADTGNLLLTTSLDAQNRSVMEEIGGIGNYIVIHTQQAQWCAGLSIVQCRENPGFLSEVAFSINSIQQAPSIDETIIDENNFVWMEEFTVDSTDTNLSESHLDNSLMPDSYVITQDDEVPDKNDLEEILVDSSQNDSSQENVLQEPTAISDEILPEVQSDIDTIHE